MRRIIFCCLVMMVHSVTADGLVYRPQIPLSELHQKKVQRAEEAMLDKATVEEDPEGDISLEEMSEEEIPAEETPPTTETPKREIPRKKVPMKNSLKKRIPTKKQKPICGADSYAGLDTSCEQPTTCKPVEENIADQEDAEIQTTCNTVGISVAVTRPKQKVIISGVGSVLRERPIKQTTKDKKGKRAQIPIRAEVTKEVQKEKVPVRQPVRKKKRRVPHNRNRYFAHGLHGKTPLLAVHYSGEYSSTSTYAPYPSGFTPTYEVTPYENYRCGLIAHCVNRPWDSDTTTTKKPRTTSTTEAIGRTGREENYELSDYQFQ